MPRLELDKVGAVASAACAIHCAALPIALGLSAAGVVSFLDHEAVEWGFVLLAAVIGTVSAWRGYRRHGNAAVAVVLAAAALGLLIVTATHHDEHTHDPGHVLAWVLPVLGLTIAVAHFVNLRLCTACRTCDHAEDEALAKSRAR